MATAVARRDDGEPESFGPAMAALNPRQREFARQYVLTGGNAAQSARLAGYGTPSTDDGGFARMGWNLKQRDGVCLAIEEETRRFLRTLGAPAVSWLNRMITGSNVKDADRLRAIDMVLVRTDPLLSGQVIQVNHDHHHRHSLSADEVTRRILELAARCGVDVKALPPTIDAVAKELPA